MEVMSNCGVPIGQEKCGILMYADDVVLIAESAEQLQENLNTLNTWTEQWRLSVNIGKTKMMHCRKPSQLLTDINFVLGELSVEKCASYRYLGFEITEHMDYSIAVNTLANASSRAFGALLAKSYGLGGFNYAIYTKLYTNCVVPVMDYAAGIWGVKRYNSPDIVQRKAMRYFLGTNKFTAIPALEGDMGWFPPYIRHRLDAVRLFIRLSRMSPDRLTKRVFLWDLDQPHSWGRNVTDVIRTSGYAGDLHDLPTGLLHTVRQHLESIYIAQWTLDIQSMPKLRTYKLLKEVFGVEGYVSSPMQKNYRSVIARMRMGVFPLHIETGRWRGLALSERLCNSCDMSVVEDEKHFLCVCPKHVNLRQELISHVDAAIGQSCADVVVKYLLNTSDIRTLVAKYIISSYQNR